MHLPADGGHPAWAPDGLTIAYASNATGQSGIWVIGVDGSAPVNLTPNLAQSPTVDFSYPAWSPDGRRIAFVYGLLGSATDIYVVDGDGSNLTRLTERVGYIWGLSWR